MQYFKERHVIPGSSVLDVGSAMVKQQTDCYRSIFHDCKYVGMDIVSGRNVDIVGWENVVQQYDYVICGQVFEHVPYVFDLMDTIAGIFKIMCCIIVPNYGKEHRHPVDCWRIFPDGMRTLFDHAGIREIEISKRGPDTFAIGALND
jgi:hypothetical protein